MSDHSLYSLPEVYADWQTTLQMSDIRPATQYNYTRKVLAFLQYAKGQNFPEDIRKITHRHLQAYFHYRKVNGIADSTRELEYTCIKKFWKWAIKEFELPNNPFDRVPPIKAQETVIKFPDPDDFQKLLDTCSTREFHDVRDKALLLLLRDTGMRIGETLALTENDFLFNQRLIHLKRTKNGQERVVAYGNTTALALSRYKRAREAHPKSAERQFFIGHKGSLTYSGVKGLFRKRGELSGVHMTPHKLRHLFVHDAKTMGASEEFLMQTLGWNTRRMMDHYARALRQQRALAEYAEKGMSPVDRMHKQRR